METTVIHTTETVGGKEYPITVTKQVGLQEILVGDRLVQIEALTITESPLGTSRSYTRAAPESTPEERTIVRRRIQEVAAQAIRDQGLW